MDDLNILWFVMLISIVIVILYGIYYIFTMEKPLTGNCNNIKRTQPDMLWNENCTYITERSYDSTLKTPTSPLYLTAFTGNKDSKPIGANVWYRYRYVNGKTGGYSQFSPWTMKPIMSGIKNLPCMNDNCDGMTYSGIPSCNSNVPVLSIKTIDYDIDSGVLANVHRVVKPPNDTSQPSSNEEGDIIGILTPSKNGWSVFDPSASKICDNATGFVCNAPKC